MAFGNKNSTPSFALTLPMKVTEQDEMMRTENPTLKKTKK